SVATLSNAMDVGNPSNWVRIADLFKEAPEALKKLIVGYTYSDEDTVQSIEAISKEYNYIACPHTAIAWKALKAYQQEHGAKDTAGVFLSTAHPCKFPDVFTPEQADKINIPEQVNDLQQKAHYATSLGTSFGEFKGYLLNNA
ncbi:threonine synthase, partial [Mucilaginibacter sp. 10I4]|nr:threonine synthase [Mucilaginibacter sp. 10I4]